LKSPFPYKTVTGFSDGVWEEYFPIRKTITVRGKNVSSSYGNGITWTQILSDDASPITQKYNVHGYPTTFLLDPDGIIRAKNLRGKELEDKINELIAE
jgi:hypothetical protein